MKAIVVYESLWGNTAAIAHAIAEGIGPDVQALSTAEASAEAIAGAGLLVVGAPVLGFSLPSDSMVKSISTSEARAAVPPDVSQPSMRSWLATVPKGSGRAAAFETRISWSPGGSTGGIERALKDAGYAVVMKGQKFVVKGRYGPLKDGELERAKAWGAELAQAMIH
jgi:flavorubredoxin